MEHMYDLLIPMKETIIETSPQKEKRQAEQRRTSNRVTVRQKRQNETIEEREDRLREARERQRLKRSNETNEERLKRLKDRAEIMRKYRLNQSEEKRQNRIKRDIERHRRRQNEETEEERAIRLQKHALSQKIRRDNETEEKRRLRLMRDIERRRRRRNNETEQERRNRLEKQALYQQIYRINETDEERKDRIKSIIEKQQKSWNEETDSGNLESPSSSDGTRKFYCTICPRSFQHFAVLQSHKMLHKPPGGFKCDLCIKTFCSIVERNQHRQIEHNCSYCCRYCEKTFATKMLRDEHAKLHNKCDVCNRAFKCHRTLVLHKAGHTGLEPFKCDVCKELFTLHHELISHQSQHTQRQSNNFISKSISMIENDDDNNKLSNIRNLSSELSDYYCKEDVSSISNTYQNQFISEDDIKTEQNSYAENDDNEEKAFDNFVEKWNINTLSEPTLLYCTDESMKMYCSVCQKSIMDLDDWKIHKKIHLDGFVCDNLEKRISSMDKEHNIVRDQPKQTVHKPYMCENCNMKFSCIEEFHEHRRLKPTTCGLPQFSDAIVELDKSHDLQTASETNLLDVSIVNLNKEGDEEDVIANDSISPNGIPIQSENTGFEEEVIYEVVDINEEELVN